MSDVIIDAWSDGGGNTGTPCACACVVYLPDGTRTERARKLPNGTNNVAEYQGVLLAMDTTQALGHRSLRIHSDSQLIVNHLTGTYKCKQDDLRALRDRVWEVGNIMFDFMEILWVPRAENRIADGLCREVLRQTSMEFSRSVSSSSRPRPGGQKSSTGPRVNPFINRPDVIPRRQAGFASRRR
jgi:ribonuclease HI